MGKHFRWTPEALKRLRQLAGKTTSTKIAAHLGCSVNSVNCKISELRLRGWRHGGSQAPHITLSSFDELEEQEKTKRASRIERMQHLSERIMQCRKFLAQTRTAQ